MKATVRTRITRTPESAAARSLSPVATSVRPKSERVTSTATAPATRHATTAQGSQPKAVPRPNWRKAVGSTPCGEPPVQKKTAPSRMSIMPRVVMKDGTRRTVVISPLTSPARPPATSRTAVITSQWASGKEPYSSAATTTPR